MKHYRLMYDYEHGDDLMFLRFDEAEIPFGRYEVDCNTVLPTEQVYCTIAEDQTEDCDYLANNLVWLVISEKVKDIFEKHNVCKCQYIRVFEKESHKMLGYLVNCLERHDALDVENSVGFDMPYGFSATKYAIRR